jgi:hypothetical protein
MDYNYGELIQGTNCQPRPVQCVQVTVSSISHASHRLHKGYVDFQQDQNVRVRQLDNEAAVVKWLGSEVDFS